jgi:uncharacterized protein (UPF0261 family)
VDARPEVTAPAVLVLATLDTKGPEAAYLADVIRRGGARPIVLDLSVFGAPATKAEISREEVAREAGVDVGALRPLPRADALATMADGARAIAARLTGAGELRGVIALGGSQGTVAGTRVMRALPFGMPKVMVSTMASADTRPYVGTADIAMFFPVVDLSGTNRFCRAVLDNAGNAVAGMARAWRPLPVRERTEVGVTMFGSTTPCVMAVAERLRARGLEPVMFHANGIGGRAFEEWTTRGEFPSVLDLTTTELADELVGGHRSAGPDRLEAAGRRGILQVIAPGALDMVNFGPRHTVPREFAHRTLHVHNAGTTLMRTTVDENRELGRWMAEKLNHATGPRGVVIPLEGFSAYDVAGGPFHDPEADAAFVRALRADLAHEVPCIEVPAHINDPVFAEAVVDLHERLGARRDG